MPRRRPPLKVVQWVSDQTAVVQTRRFKSSPVRCARRVGWGNCPRRHKNGCVCFHDTPSLPSPLVALSGDAALVFPLVRWPASVQRATARFRLKHRNSGGRFLTVSPFSPPLFNGRDVPWATARHVSPSGRCSPPSEAIRQPDPTVWKSETSGTDAGASFEVAAGCCMPSACGPGERPGVWLNRPPEWTPRCSAT
jgi:hypothetical protein